MCQAVKLTFTISHLEPKEPAMSAKPKSLSKQEENVLAAVSAGPLDPDDSRNTQERRSKNRVRGLNHHAYYARDVEQTRHFYEDILEMPLTVFLTIPDEVFTGDPLPYSHFFFEMGDGSAIAFFDYPAFHEGKATYRAPSVYDHHIALQVNSDADIEYFRRKLEANGVKHSYVDHGAFHSIYFEDPNGLNLELCTLPEIAEEFGYRAAKIAHDELKKWQKIRATVRRS
jgi:catechol 2,3-dioxygenase-like lactoylglutathione lyase family enzyme